MIKPYIKKIFSGKRVTVMGLGLLGGALNDTIFLAKCGAQLTVTDLKTAEELKTSLVKLKKYKNIKYVLGKHRLEDFQSADLILQPGNVPMNSPYLAEAKKHNIPVYVSESLFFENLPQGVKTIGVTGTRGKSTTTQLIYEILKQAPKIKGRVFLAGNVKNVSTLALLEQVKVGDIVVMELDSWALHGMGDIKQSPHISVFTNFMVDHQNFYGATKEQNGMDLYFADKANIFLNQKDGDYLIAGQAVLKLIQKKWKKFSGKTIVPDVDVIPQSWKIKILGEHNRQNIAYAVTVARILDIPEKEIKKVVEGYGGVSGRLEFMKEIKGVKYYNDTTATTPEACLAALNALKTSLKSRGGIILISGGTDKMLDFKQYAKDVPKAVKALILFKGTATEKIVQQLRITNDKCQMNKEFVIPVKTGIQNNLPIVVVDNMKDAVVYAKKYAVKNDIILLSPGAASFGIFKNEFDRGEQFVKLVDSIS